MAAVLESHRGAGMEFVYPPLPEETHASVYHPAAIKALRTVLAPTMK